MKIFKLGEKSKGVCNNCKKFVPTTFKLCTVPLSSGKGSVDDILAATCDKCDHVVSIPQQSTPRIKEALNTKKHSIEVRLPRHLLDILLLASDSFEIGNPELLKDSLIRHYIGRVESDKNLIKTIKKLSQSDFAKGAGYRLSLKVNDAIFERFERIRKHTSLNKTQILKGLILLINEDILQHPLKKKLNEVESALLASA
jgi:RNase P subunit RPR2